MRARVQGQPSRGDVIGWRSGQCEGRRLHRGKEQEGIKNQLLLLHVRGERCIGGHSRRE